MGIQTPEQDKNQQGMVYTEWFPNATGLSFKIKKVLADTKSELQHIQIFETETHGKLLVMDDCVMLTERDESAYHEMLVHVPLLAHPNPKRVLVIGGGDGGSLREIVRHANVEVARQVEIDGEVVRLSKEHFPALASSYDHPKVDLIVGNGIKFLKEAEDKSYDVILIDSTDPFGPALGLFNEEFYTNVHRVLADDGIVTCQAESYVYDMETLKNITSIMKKLFPLVRVYTSQIPTYPSGTWCFALGSKGPDPLGMAIDDPRAVAIEMIGSQYWNRDMHYASFAIPTYARKELFPEDYEEIVEGL